LPAAGAAAMIAVMAVRILAAVGMFLGMVACGRQAAPPLAGDGELVLELGRGHRSLAGSLQAAGLDLLPRCDYGPPPPRAAVEDAPAQPAADAEAPRRAPPPDEPGQSAPAVAPPAAEPAAATWFEVELEERQTLFLLARKHLGSANRFKEILELNGWSDAEARRLRPGQRVRIPKAAS
jgi:hypothetical protein